MASCEVYLYTFYKNKNGKHPIKIRIIHKRKIRYLSLGKYASADEWDPVNKCVYRSSDNYKKLLNFLHNKLVSVENTILGLETKNPNIKIDEIMRHLKTDDTNMSFNKYTDNLITELKKSKQFGLAASFETAKNAILTFHARETIYFDEITPSFLKRWERFYLSKEKGNSINGLSVYMRSVRSIINSAIRESIVDKETYPFTDYKIRTQKTRKRAINKSSMDSIKNLDLVPEDKNYYFWNYFLFMFNCRGISWKDLCLLEWDKNIINNRIEYQRTKTKSESKGYSIKITLQIQEILNRFKPKDQKKPKGYIFPVITETDPERIYKQIKNKLKIYNSGLNEIAEKAGITINLTSYVSRHSWASIAKKMNIPIPVISESLGHENMKTTQIYLDSFDYDVLDDANELVTS